MRCVLFCISFFIVFNFYGQRSKVRVGGYELIPVVDLDVTPIKNQYRSGTCWGFSGLSFLESEVLRMKDTEVDLAEMWLIRHDYHERAIDYVRFHGAITFGPGAESNDVMDMIKLYGIVPEAVYSGLNYGTDMHVHGELDNVLEAIVNAVVENKNRKLSTAWVNAFDNVLDAYFGETPAKFKWKGEEHTPKTFQQALNIVPDEYIEISSFSHHPFYTKFIMEVPDNWAFGEVYNVKLEEFFNQAVYALDNGYTLLWGSDVSEEGFSNRNAIALVPATEIENLSGSEKEKWESMSAEERERRLYSFSKPIPEKHITQEIRQKAFDDYRTQDDHGMHIVGYYKDNDGDIFFKVKNTWGESNNQGGYFYASEAFFKYKSLSIMLHKDALMPSIKTKLGF